jgi:hypothetical protein
VAREFPAKVRPACCRADHVKPQGIRIPLLSWRDILWAENGSAVAARSGPPERGEGKPWSVARQRGCAAEFAFHDNKAA